MGNVIVAHTTSLDGFMTGPNDRPEQALGEGGQRLFDWYFGGDTPSRHFEGFRLARANAEVVRVKR